MQITVNKIEFSMICKALLMTETLYENNNKPATATAYGRLYGKLEREAHRQSSAPPAAQNSQK